MLTKQTAAHIILKVWLRNKTETNKQINTAPEHWPFHICKKVNIDTVYFNRHELVLKKEDTPTFNAANNNKKKTIKQIKH